MYVSTAVILVTWAIIVSSLPNQEASTINAASPNIITRAQWSARNAKGPKSNLTVNPPTFVIIHHSATEACTTREMCEKKVRSFQNYHMDVNKWDDIGYNFLVGEDGNVYEGRGWGIRGAHSIPYNSRSIGICVIGNFEDRVPQNETIVAVQDLIAYGVSSGEINSSYTLYGHNQGTATECPGRKLYELIKSWPHWQNKQ